jgi:uncharacterized membrane protein
VLLASAIAYFILTRVLLASHGQDSTFAKALGSDFKGKVSMVLYAVAIAAAFWHTSVALGIYALVALWWLVPDRRFERLLAEHKP